MKFFQLVSILSISLCLKADENLLVTCNFIHTFCGYTNDQFTIEPEQGIIYCPDNKCTLTQRVQLIYEAKISFWTRWTGEYASKPSLELRLNQQTIWSSDNDRAVNSYEWRLVERQLPPLKFNVIFVINLIRL